MSTSIYQHPTSGVMITDSDTVNFSKNIDGNIICRKIGNVVFVFVVATKFNETLTTAASDSWATIPQKYRPSSTKWCVFGLYQSPDGSPIPMGSASIGSSGNINQAFASQMSINARYIGIWMYNV